MKQDSNIRGLAERLWDYHRLNHQLAPAGAILVLCSHDERVAERGAHLFLEGYAPLLIFSGGQGAITQRLWNEPEAERFARIAMRMHVPHDSILIESKSTNTGENVQFTRKLLAERGIDPESFVVVQKPYMERRSYATFLRYWPEKPVVVTSPQVSFADYLAQYTHSSLTPDDVIGIMCGDLQRIRFYPELGYQIAQEIPDDVWNAFEQLVEAGYDKYLIREKETTKC
ncbi:MAG TPA: YdcF family protein [Pyrinomonadaceae bacterium]|nr:YdcF family protein [Pyrinomonadaceae bacterium]